MLLAAVALFCFLPGLGEPPIYQFTEGQQALVAREIVGGDWLLPRPDGDRLPSKPPLFGWLGAMASLAAGAVTHATIRLPSALATTGSVVAVYALARPMLGQPTAILAGLVFLTTPAVATMAREASTDATLSFFLLLALLAFRRMLDERRFAGRWRITFFLAIAAAVLAKGPVGLALPILFVAAFLALGPGFAPLRELFSGVAWLLAVVPPALWYVAATLAAGEAFVAKHLVDENLRRFFGGFGRSAPLHFMVSEFFEQGFPWSLVFAAGLLRLVWTRRWDDRSRFAVLWWAVVIVAFTLSFGKRSVYLLPLYPAMAIVAAGWGWPWWPETPPRWPRATVIATAVMTVLGLASFAVVGAIAAGFHPPPAVLADPRAPRWLRADWLVGAIDDHPVRIMAVAFLVCLGPVPILRRALAGRWREAAGALLAILVLLQLSGFPTLRIAYKKARSMKPFVEEVARRVPPGEPLAFVAYDLDESKGFLSFYLDHHLPDAPCERLAKCPRGHYLLWESAWPRQANELGARAVVLARSRDTAPRARYEPIVLVRLDP